MKNAILKTITFIMVLVFLVGACAVDSVPNTIPVIMCFGSLAWFLLFMLANHDMELKGE